MYGNPTSPESFADLLPTLRQVMLNAEARAKTLAEFVHALENEDPAKIDAHIGNEYAGPGWVRDLLARVDETSHIHSGSSDASSVRTLTGGLLALLGRLQRGTA